MVVWFSHHVLNCVYWQFLFPQWQKGLLGVHVPKSQSSSTRASSWVLQLQHLSSQGACTAEKGERRWQLKAMTKRVLSNTSLPLTLAGESLPLPRRLRIFGSPSHRDPRGFRIFGTTFHRGPRGFGFSEWPSILIPEASEFSEWPSITIHGLSDFQKGLP